MRIISLRKAKEFQGHLFREGRVRCNRPFEAFDHDFPDWAEGVIIPHGIYDPVRNRGHINIGLSHDTTEFACHSIRWYWNRIGRQCYSDAKSILLLVDCGGSNSATKYIFKHDLQAVVNAIGVEISGDPCGTLSELLLDEQIPPTARLPCGSKSVEAQ